MRGEVELLQLLRANLHSDLFTDGLCSLIQDMFIEQIIDSKEYFSLRRLLFNNAPIKYSRGLYWWFPYKRTARDEFLNQLIEKYEH